MFLNQTPNNTNSYNIFKIRVVIIEIPNRGVLLPVNSLPKCPNCHSEYTYQDGILYICPECAHEWSSEQASQEQTSKIVYKDAYGTELQDGDTVTVIKDLKIKGSSSVVKVGTKVKNIRLVEGDHDIDCKIDGIGPMKLKSEFVKKV